MSQTDAVSGDALVYIVDGPYAEVYHPDSHCPNFDGEDETVRRVPVSLVPDRRVCGRCRSNRPGDSNWKNGECRRCGTFVGNDECEFCKSFDLIHDIPTDAEFCPIQGQEDRP